LLPNDTHEGYTVELIDVAYREYSLHDETVLLVEDQRSKLCSAEAGGMVKDRLEYGLQCVRRTSDGAQHCRESRPLFKEPGHLPLLIGLVHVDSRRLRPLFGLSQAR
jgi:hypothetical protein